MENKHTQNTGGMAFPATEQNGINFGEPGMTLRDYFASDAMKAIVTASGIAAYKNPSDVASGAYRLADYMLDERDKNRPSEVLTALSRLLAQCDRTRICWMPESDAEKFARQFVTPEAQS